MIYVLLVLLITAIVCAVLGNGPRWAPPVRGIAVGGTLLALVIALQQEGLEGAGVANGAAAWPAVLDWLGTPFYAVDPLSSGLGLWCLFLGGLLLLRIGREEATGRQLAVAVLTTATLYSLVHTTDLRAFAGQVILLALLAWTLPALDPDAESGPTTIRRNAALTVGASSLLGAALLIGRTTGGTYDLNGMSLSALTVWPLVLIATFVVMWLGLSPFSGWSAMGYSVPNTGTSPDGALVQSLTVGVPAVVLVLRLQALVTGQALAGSIPAEWTAFSTALVWAGAITVVVAGAGAIVWAGTPRWSALLTAHVMGIIAWGLGLDTAVGRYAALAALLAYGLGRLTVEFASGRLGWATRVVAGASMAGAPLTAGFVGVWLLSSAMVDIREPVLALLIVGGVVMAATGAALHLASRELVPEHAQGWRRSPEWIGLTGAVLLFVAGAFPGLWLPRVEAMATVAGGSRLNTPWTGIQSGTMFAPLTLLAFGALAVALIAWLLRLWGRSTVTGNSALLPTALDRLQKAGATQSAPLPQALLSNPPAAVWWLSLAWLEGGVYGFGVLLARLGLRFGGLLSRLEGRYYLPLALILTLLLVLAVAR